MTWPWFVAYAALAAVTLTVLIVSERRQTRQAARARHPSGRRRDVIDRCLICELEAAVDGWVDEYDEVMRGDDL